MAGRPELLPQDYPQLTPVEDAAPEQELPQLTPVDPEQVPFLELQNQIDAPDEKLGVSVDPHGAVGSAVRASQNKQRLKDKYSDLEIAKVLSNQGKDGEYDPTLKFESNLGNITSTIDLARSDLFAEQYAKFKASYPMGSLAPIPTKYGGTVLVAKAKPGDPWRQVGGIGSTVESLLNETNVGAGAAGIAAGMLDAPLLGTAAAVGLGAAAGTYAKSKIENMRGYEFSTTGDIIKQAGADGILNALFEPVGWMLTGVKGKQGLMKAQTKLKFAELQEATGVPIYKGQASGPLVRSIYSITGPISQRQQRALLEQKNAVKALIEPRADVSALSSSYSDDELVNALDSMHSIILQKEGLGPRVANAPDTLQTAMTYSQALDIWDELATQGTDRLYNRAEQLARGEVISFDMRPLKQEVDNLSRSDYLYGNPRQLDDGTTETPNVDVEAPFSNPALARIAQNIRDIADIAVLNPDNTAYSALKKMRSEVGTIGSTAMGRDKMEADALYETLTETINSPMGGSPQFQQAWTVANDVYKTNHNFMRLSKIKAALNEGVRAEQLADNLLKPDVNFITALRRNLQSSRATAPAWDMLREGAIRDLVTNKAKDASEIIQAMVPQQRNAMFTPQEQNIINRVSLQTKQLENGPIKLLLGQADDSAGRVLQLAGDSKVTKAQIDQFLEPYGGPDSPAAQDLKASVFKTILDNSLVGEGTMQAGEKTIDPALLTRQLDNLFGSRRLDSLFTPQDIERFRNWERLGVVMAQATDFGSSLQKAELAGGFLPSNDATFLQPIERSHKLISSYITLAFRDRIGSYLSRPLDYKAILDSATGNESKKMMLQILRVNNNFINEKLEQANNREYMPSEPSPYELTPDEVRKVNQNRQQGSSGYGMDMLNMGIGAAKSIYNMLPGTGSEPPPPPAPAPAPAPAPPPAPAPQQQGAAPPMPSPMQQGIGSKYAALFPNDSLGAMASMRG